jgi:hypothetical protein
MDNSLLRIGILVVQLMEILGEIDSIYLAREQEARAMKHLPPVDLSFLD